MRKKLGKIRAADVILLLHNFDLGTGFTVSQNHTGISARLLFALVHIQGAQEAIRYLTFVKLPNSCMVGVKLWSAISF